MVVKKQFQMMNLVVLVILVSQRNAYRGFNSMAQQSFSQVSPTIPARRESDAIVENPATEKNCVCVELERNAIGKTTVAGTLQYHKEQFAKGHKCICPKRFVIPVRPHNTDYVEQQCQICANVFGRIYDA